MTYKQFVAWCNKRACGGQWSMGEAKQSIAVMRFINSKPFWKREKAWQKFSAGMHIRELHTKEGAQDER